MNQPLINIERNFRPEIEGLRFVAALLVAIYHIWLNRVSGGVDVFFVISGFLITTSIISTINRTGEFHFRPYVTKLLKRLLPSVFFILGIVLVLSWFLLPASILNKTIREVFASMFFFQNWQLAFSSTDYLDSSQMKSPVEHFWALSIQGQFYLIWFLVFTVVLFMLKKYKIANPKTLINTVLGILFVSSFAYSIYMTAVNQPWAYFITMTRVWEFALGSLLCVNLSSMRINKYIAALIGWLGLIGLILTGIIFEVSELFPGYVAMWPMVCALFIVLSGTQDTAFSVKRLLGSPVLVKLGGISFGIYLWHWVLLQFYRYNVQQTPSLIDGTVIIIVSIVISFFMTKYIEEPIRNSTNNRFSFKRLGILGSVNLLLIGSLVAGSYIKQNELDSKITEQNYPGALAAASPNDLPVQEPIPAFAEVFSDLPQAHLDGSNQGMKNSDLKIGEYGETENYDATIALIGSSHSEHWLGAVLEAAKNNNYRVLNITRSGTRFSTGYTDDDLKGKWVNNVLEYLKDEDIDLILAQATASNTSNDKTQSHLVDQLQFVNAEYGIEVLAIRDVPRYDFNVLESLETEGLEATAKKMNSIDNQKDESFWKQFEQENKSLHKIDFSEYFKVDGKFNPVIGNVVIYRDNRHLTNTYSESFGPVFEEKIQEILKDL
ncbi:peptidoglycan/LPS O-acetylase OafA/YrhL [Planomicrobium koreense]|uniref:Peptidoglycan/LPS O-acetylase OafA/YrhL n=1 Tax=Planococcus koreensis TaxID=112331 RepID=A0A7W8CS92_9BACL|nr:acyltransferase family protein [Planococcus koreensis]MBB5179894.1 peptidoglycan/LPS O-acetylase OafA/YrhL [Planococcus koreensis]